jgi:diaminopimelate epimerase
MTHPENPANLVQVWKYHALGNDYLVMAAPEAPEPALIQRLCDRHTGVGSDGVLLGDPSFTEPFQLRIFNPDGGEAERSGNGLRIFAQFLRDEGKAQGDGCRIRIPAGEVQARFLEAGVEVDMGLPRFQAGALPFLGLPEGQEVVAHPVDLEGERVAVTCLSLGNPHCVLVVPESSPEGARHWGPLLEGHPRFPRRVNVEVVQVLDRGRVRAHIWERGAGYTLASGTGATASAAAARRLGLVGDEVRVEMPGGVLEVRFAPDGRATLTGPVVRVFQAELDAAWLCGQA